MTTKPANLPQVHLAARLAEKAAEPHHRERNRLASLQHSTPRGPEFDRLIERIEEAEEAAAKCYRDAGLSVAVIQVEGFHNERTWPHEKFSATASDGTIVSVSRNGEGWMVSTYRAEVPFGNHHRVAQHCIPEADFEGAFDLGRTILAGIDADCWYEDKRRGFVPSDSRVAR